MTRPGFRLALLATVIALVVVMLGAYTRLTHAGLGCPDWPGCYGFMAVPDNPQQLEHAQLLFPDSPVQAGKGWSEMIHRYFAGGLTLIILLLAAQAWRHRQQEGHPFRLAVGLLAVVVAQAAFGMWTVTLQLWPQVVASHLMGGIATLCLLCLLTLRLSNAFPTLPDLPQRVRTLAGLGLMLVAMQVALGGWVSANYAAMACTDLPTCQGRWWPDADFTNAFHLAQQIGPNYQGGHLDSEARTAIHLAHRMGALLVTLTLLALAWQLKRAGLRRLAAMLVMALGVQVALGLGNVLLHLPLALAFAHSAGGAVLMLGMTVINYRVARPWPLFEPAVARLRWARLLRSGGPRLNPRDALK